MRASADASSDHVVRLDGYEPELVPWGGAMLAATEPKEQAGASFPADPSSPARARQLVMAALRRWGLSEQLVDDATLIVSELASNAVRHARSCFSVSLELRGSTLRLAAADATPLGMSTPAWELNPQQLHGLGVIQEISRCWGVQGTRDGKIVWAELRHSR
jgi:anti-sigma regulatory factor (Ser/Thr protein kinase)